MANLAVKLILLTVCFLGCLVTLFTSPNILMGYYQDPPTLRPDFSSYCQKDRLCPSSTVEATSCPWERLQKECAAAVQRAYQKLNLGHCLYQIQQQTLCQREWCEGNGALNPSAACQEECALSQTQLQTCIDAVVFSYLRRNHLISASS